MKEETGTGRKIPLMFKGQGETEGLVFTQFLRNREAYVFRVFNSTSQKIHYETFHRRVFEQIDEEIYPCRDSFGIWARHSATLENAIKVFFEISG